MSATTLDRDAILRLLPHRDPFVFVDAVHELVPGDRVTAVYRVPTDAFWVPGHFPGNPVMPGVLIGEALAQTAALVAFAAHPELIGKFVYLVGMDKMRFRRVVRPGDELRLAAVVTRKRRKLWTYEVVASVGEELAAEGQFLAALAPDGAEA